MLYTDNGQEAFKYFPASIFGNLRVRRAKSGVTMMSGGDTEVRRHSLSHSADLRTSRACHGAVMSEPGGSSCDAGDPGACHEAREYSGASPETIRITRLAVELYLLI